MQSVGSLQKDNSHLRGSGHDLAHPLAFSMPFFLLLRPILCHTAHHGLRSLTPMCALQSTTPRPDMNTFRNALRVAMQAPQGSPQEPWETTHASCKRAEVGDREGTLRGWSLLRSNGIHYQLRQGSASVYALKGYPRVQKMNFTSCLKPHTTLCFKKVSL